jgi:hypothetical protein
VEIQGRIVQVVSKQQGRSLGTREWEQEEVEQVLIRMRDSNTTQ